ncbi:NUDIX domain-containing protein [Aureimonas mangrovi]|uniref:NUDIX domain-containing protein n=1 Tax=Aureimonas mangrovi TaxID=2758041 RepID=UPI00163D9171|nr:NUDIX domain-containing protein [Aureimonas mangrovi]
MALVDAPPLPPVKQALRPTLGVSACLFVAGQLLLVERGRAPYEGCFTLPGGRVEFGERLQDAVARELYEETGLEAELAFLRLHEAIEPGIHAVIAVFTGSLAAADPQAGHDARAVRLVEAAEFAELEDTGRLTPGLGAIVRAVGTTEGWGP